MFKFILASKAARGDSDGAEALAIVFVICPAILLAIMLFILCPILYIIGGAKIANGNEEAIGYVAEGFIGALITFAVCNTVTPVRLKDYMKPIAPERTYWNNNYENDFARYEEKLRIFKKRNFLIIVTCIAAWLISIVLMVLSLILKGSAQGIICIITGSLCLLHLVSTVLVNILFI